jgi:hypothetical protein
MSGWDILGQIVLGTAIGAVTGAVAASSALAAAFTGAVGIGAGISTLILAFEDMLLNGVNPCNALNAALGVVGIVGGAALITKNFRPSVGQVRQMYNRVRGWWTGEDGVMPSGEWKVGDPINTPDAEGNDPSWRTATSRYWQNRAANAEPAEFSPQNLGRMRAGRAPVVRIIARIRATGEEVELFVARELHHIEGRAIPDPHNPTNLQEVWPWEHEAIDPNRHLGYDFLRFR